MALIGPLAWEPAASAALEKTKKKKKHIHFEVHSHICLFFAFIALLWCHIQIIIAKSTVMKHFLYSRRFKVLDLSFRSYFIWS